MLQVGQSPFQEQDVQTDPGQTCLGQIIDIESSLGFNSETRKMKKTIKMILEGPGTTFLNKNDDAFISVKYKFCSLSGPLEELFQSQSWL
jgi:hypothetical protein